MLATHEIDSFASLPSSARAVVERWVNVLERVLAGVITKEHAADSMGCDLATVYRKLNAVKAKGWEGLVPGYRGPHELPEAFKEYLRKLMGQYQRNSRAAVKELYRRWQRREVIDGYDGHPGWPNLPLGWSYGNLMRHQPPKIQRAAMRQGLGRAMADHGPKVFSTRAGLHVLARLQFDDVEHDNFVHLLEQRQVCRVAELGVLDVLSGTRFLWGSQPMLKRAEDGKTDSLKESAMRFFLCHVLMETGYSTRGTELIIERGTATLRDRVIDLLHKFSGGKITVRKGGMSGKEQSVAGIGEGRGKGNPRHKAALESLHNLIHNEMGALPAQTGLSTDQRPEYLHGVLNESADWLAVMDELPEHVRQQLLFPTLEYYSQFCPMRDAIYKQINGRTWHDLEGWAACGYMSADYRLHEGSDQWISASEYLALPGGLRNELAIAARSNPMLCRPRKLSPSEVFNAEIAKGRASGEIVKPPVGLIAEILYEDLAQPRQCRDSYFVFQDKTISPEPLRFESCIITPDGREMELTDRETFEVVVNPYQPKTLFVYGGTRKRGAFLGTARAVDRFTQNDHEQATRELGRQQQRRSRLLSPLRKRHADITRDTAARLANNSALIEQSRGILTGPAAAAAAKATRESLDDLIEADEPVIIDVQNDEDQTEADGVEALL